MNERNQVYKCNQFGKITEVVGIGSVGPVCCGEAMELLKEN